MKLFSFNFKDPEHFYIRHFFEQLPKVLKIFIDEDQCNLLTLLNKQYPKRSEGNESYKALFSESYDQAFYEYHPSRFYIASHRELESIGMTGSSLKLKFSLLQDICNDILKIGDKIINLKIPNVKELIRKFFKLLNSILGSFKAIFPILEPIVEFKEQLECANDMLKDDK